MDSLGTNESMASGYCHDALWDTPLLLTSPWPRLTSCFRSTVLTFIPLACLWLPLPLYLYNTMTSSPRPRPLPTSVLSLIKMFLSLSMALLSLVIALHNVTEGGVVIEEGGAYGGVTESIPPARVLALFLRAVSYMTLLLLVHMERRHHQTTSVIPFVTWSALAICDVVPVYSHVFLQGSGVSFLEYVLFMVIYAMEVIQVLLTCIADNLGVESKHARTSPEMQASYPSQLLHLWALKTVYRGWRHELEEVDLFDLNPRDTSRTLTERFERTWSMEQSRLKRKFDGHLSMDNGHNGSPTSEKTRLIGTSSKRKFDSANNTFKPYKLESPSLLTVIAKMTIPWLSLGILKKLVSDCFVMISPIILSLLIEYADNAEDDYQWKGYTLAILMFVVQMLKSVLYNASFWSCQMIGLQLKTILIGAIYKKSLTMNNEAKKESTAGEIVNLMSVDTQRINDMMMIFILAWTTPFQVILAITILYQYLGPAALAGLAVMLMTVPFNAYVARVTETLQEENLKFKDARLRLTNESLSGMKVLKLYAWEPSFRDKITAIRDGEIGILRKIAFLNALSYVVFSWTPYLVTLVTFAVYVSTGSDNQLTAGKAFVALSFFNIIKVPLALLSTIISQSVQAKVSVDRISKFLSTGDLSPKNVQRDGHAANAIEVNNGNFSWDREKSPTLRNINLRVPKGSLCAVVGPVGSGKSSLVSALLGEMEKMTGSVVVSHQVAYVPQQAWIQCATVKDNILFGKPFNRRRYNRVIEACALERDLEILSAGDLTEIGEKGINLSGGQKQRVSLARAVYSGADIFMFDDPLSAVDAHVGKYIFDRVIGKSGILKGKTRVLVTHGANWLPMVDSILVMMNGKISESGAYEDLMNGKAGFADFIKTHLVQPKAKNNDEEEVTPQRSNMLSRSKSRNEQNNAGSDGMTSGEEGVKLAGRPKPRRRQTSVFEASMASMLETSVTLGNKGQGYSFEEDKAKAKSGKLVQKETLQSGNVKLSVFMSYATAAGCLPLLASIVLFLGSAVSYAAATFWITDWTEDPLLGNASLVNTPEWDDRNAYYLGVFSVFGILQVVLLAIHNLLYWTRCVKAAQVLHHDVLGCVLRSPMAFFDTTPLGRIMNRFSRDVEVVDNLLPMNFRDYIFTFTNCVLTMLIITINTPLFLLMAVPILGVYFFIQSFYIPTGRQLKRIESVTRSPIYSHFSETLSGGPTIRAYGVTERFQQELMARVDRNQSFWYINLACNRWLGISLETLANFVVFGAAMFGVLTPGLGGGALGLSVSYALQVSGSLIWMVRQKTELETNSVSVERIKEYSELMPEADWVVPHRRPVPEWPQEGVVTFTDYRTRYRDGLDLVLKGMTCEFKGGEKIGIVGRTGAGKSSLALAMFRLIEASSGAISVDGVRISDIGLHDVRAKLTILPQDPVLFFGSLRMNLDPEGMYTDHKLWQALTSAHLKEFVQNTRERLDYQVGEEGQSLSVGQRQLVCLARALLKKTRILILDEATAAVDMDTDQLIQSTIRSEFSSCTIITIAHRLNTIMDYDRIMVLDAGLITEMDTPTNLLADPSSVFYSMAKEAGLV